MPVFDKTNTNGGLLFKEAVRGDSGERVGNEVLEGAGSGVVTLGYVLELAVDRFNQSAFSQQDFVRTLIREFFMLFFTLVINCMPLRNRFSNRVCPIYPLPHRVFLLYSSGTLSVSAVHGHPHFPA